MGVLVLYLLRLIMIFTIGFLSFDYTRSLTGSLFIATAVGTVVILLFLFLTPAPEGGRFDL